MRGADRRRRECIRGDRGCCDAECRRAGCEHRGSTVEADDPATLPHPLMRHPLQVDGWRASALKIIFIILGIFLFLGLLGMGSCAYIAYRAKQKINAFSGEMKSRPYRGRKDPCALVSMTEVGGAVGQQVIGMEPVGTSACLYHFGNGRRIAVKLHGKAAP